MRYGKFLTDQTDGAEEIITTSDGGEYTDEVLRKLKFYPIETVGENTGNCRMSYTLVDDENGGHMEERFIQPPQPPRTISKFKLKLAIASKGFLAQFEQLLASVEVLPGYSGAAAFADAVTLDEDNEKFKDAVKAVKTEFGLTDEQVEGILAASVAD